MKAKDLRLGNIIYNPVQQINLVVDISVLNEVFYDEKRKPKKAFEPIKITNEWLLKLGFKQGGLGGWMKENFEFTNSENRFLYVNGVSRRIEHIKYVHQFQNYYYFYKNKELKIKNGINL